MSMVPPIQRPDGSGLAPAGAGEEGVLMMLHPSVYMMGFGCCKVQAEAGFTIHSSHQIHPITASEKQTGGWEGIDGAHR